MCGMWAEPRRSNCSASQACSFEDFQCLLWQISAWQISTSIGINCLIPFHWTCFIPFISTLILALELPRFTFFTLLLMLFIFIGPCYLCSQVSAVYFLKGKNTPLGTKTFTLTHLCFRPHDAFLCWEGTQLHMCWCLCPRCGEASAGRGTLGCCTWAPCSQRTLVSSHASRSSVCCYFVEREPQRAADPRPQDVHTLLSPGYQQA